MKKIVLTNGLISGSIVAVLMLVTMPFMHSDEASMGYGMLVGYATMAIAFSLIYVAIRKFRETEGAGRITFGKSFLIGISITAITSVFYALAWEVCYHTFASGFIEQWGKMAVDQAVMAGKSEVDIAQLKRDMDEFAANYRQPVYRFFMTLTEIFPVGLLVTLICSFILKRK